MAIISERAIERIVLDVAPKVERLTGWDPGLDGLTVKIVRRDQFWEEGIRPKYEFLGLDLTATTQKGKAGLHASKTVMPMLALGLYEPSNSTMLIVAENIGHGTNESAVATTVGHELVHRCQFLHNHAFTRLHHALVRRTTGSKVYEDDPHEDPRAVPIAQAYMTLVEGDARFVETQLKKMHYQDAQTRASLLANVLGLMLAATGGFAQKLQQYSKGSKIVERIYRAEGRAGVNKLYALDEHQLLRRFG